MSPFEYPELPEPTTEDFAMTPSDIARATADKIRNGIHETMIHGASPVNLEALILSAAAKMVQQTGACDAMLKARSELEYTWARLGNRDAQFDKTHAELSAALTALRALTEHKP